ncbi:MAG: DUF3455 domain-containing protein [Comamonadaceae bacterium]|nr:DUF3455 domain-containing protein [Comamonadaceae bacterium]
MFDARGARDRHATAPARSGRPRDGSRVVGTVKARADAPAAGAIPWLLLRHGPPAPTAPFSSVTSIQRVNTARRHRADRRRAPSRRSHGCACPTRPTTGSSRRANQRCFPHQPTRTERHP